jgi:large subunit ribosomal protein L3
MPNKRSPRHGSMGVWPRKRAIRETPRIRSWTNKKEPGLLGFVGYKAGMTHVHYINNRKASITKGEELQSPVTIVECPPLKLAAVRFYKNTIKGRTVSTEIHFKADKELARKKTMPKKLDDKKLDTIKPEEYDDLVVLLYTQPKLTGIGKKKPAFFEMGLGGSKEDKLTWVKEHIGKEIPVSEVLQEGQQYDTIAVTTGRGFQGPVKRFGIGLKSHKAEKSRRNPGSLGGWKGHGHFMYRVAHAGQTGYHRRTEYNKWLLKILESPKEINPKGGIVRYGLVKNTCLLFKGSIQGPKKRLVRINVGQRPANRIPKEAPDITNISLASPQGV